MTVKLNAKKVRESILLTLMHSRATWQQLDRVIANKVADVGFSLGLSLSRALDDLTRKGFLENRSNMYDLTASGRQLAERLWRLHDT